MLAVKYRFSTVFYYSMIKKTPSPLLPAALIVLAGVSVASALDVTAQYFRFTQQKLRDDAAANSIQLSEFELLYKGALVPGAVAANPGGNSPDGELPDFAVDGDVNTKWLDFNKLSLELSFPAAVTVDGYRFATGGDAPERDPVTWIVESSNDGLEWSQIESREDFNVPLQRNAFIPNLLFLEPDPLEITEFISNRPKIGTGESALLFWNIRGASTVSITPEVGTVAASGSVEVSPAAPTTYTITATQGSQTATATTTVTPIVRGAQSFQFFRFTPTALRDPAADSIQLSEFDIVSGSTRLEGATVTNPGGDSPGAELPASVADGDVNTKWLDFNKAPLVFDFGAPVSADGYRFATANDFDARDPISWTLEGSADGSIWTVLDTVENFPATKTRLTYTGDVPLAAALPPGASLSVSPVHLQAGETATLTWNTANAASVQITPPVPAGNTLAGTATVTPPAGTAVTYTITATNPAGSATRSARVYAEGPVSPVTHKFFRFTQTALRDGALANSIQLSELEFSVSGERVIPITVLNEGGNSPAGELPEFAADGDPNTKWLDFNRAPLVYEFAEPVAVDGYRIATGGDAAERDPFAWTIEGSADGTAWTVIDTRDIGFVIPADRNAYTNYFRFSGGTGPVDKVFAEIAGVNYNAASSTVAITFASPAGFTYRIESSPNLSTWATAADNIASAGATTTQTVSATGTRLFFQVVAVPLAP